MFSYISDCYVNRVFVVTADRHVVCVSVHNKQHYFACILLVYTLRCGYSRQTNAPHSLYVYVLHSNPLQIHTSIKCIFYSPHIRILNMYTKIKCVWVWRQSAAEHKYMNEYNFGLLKMVYVFYLFFFPCIL